MKLNRHETERKRLFSGALALLTAFSMTAGLAGCGGKQEDGLSVEITPQTQDNDGVPTDTVFRLTSNAPVRAELLPSLLAVEPAVPLSFSGSGKDWTLTPEEPLTENTVYTFSVKNAPGKPEQTFAFQTKGDLAVSSTYPYNGADYVDVNTGIEITFHSPGVDPAGSIVIQPEIQGSWSSNGYVSAFVPSAPLEENSIYRVTLKAGLAAPNGKVLTEDYTFSFETTSASDDRWYYDDLRLTGAYTETFLPGDPLLVEMNGSEKELEGIPFSISIGRYADLKAYSAEVRARDTFYRTRFGKKEEYTADHSKLEEVASYESQLFPKAGANWIQYVSLPELEPGWYLVTISGTSQNGRPQFVQKQIQVCSRAVYFQSSNGQTLVWLNDPDTGKPLSNCKFTLEDSQTGEAVEGKTAQDGTAVLDTSKLETAYLTLYDANQANYFEPVALSSHSDMTLNQKYYTAIYTDREIYQPDDTIHFWGMVLPRKSEYGMPKEVTALLGNYLPSFSLYSQSVPVKEDGTFEGTIELVGVKKDYYSLHITDGKIYPDPKAVGYAYGSTSGIYTTASLSVGEYTKPPYVITSETQKDWYFANEPIHMNVKESYFDGTPVSSGVLSINASMAEVQGDLTAFQLGADGRGDIVLTYKDDSQNYDPAYYSYPSWRPSTIWYSLTSGDSEDVYFNYSGEVPVLLSKIACKTQWETPSSLAISTAQIDTKKLDQWYADQSSWSYPGYDELAGPSVDVPLTIVVHKWETVRTPNGSYYDPVNKKTVQKYTYDRVPVIEETLSVQTTNGKALFPTTAYQNDSDSQYWFEIQFDGQIQGTVSEQVYTSASNGNTELTSYQFYNAEEDSTKFHVGEAVPLSLYANQKKTENKGRVLYTVLQKGILDSGIYTSNELKLPFKEEYIPNISLAGAYFDGKHIYQVDLLGLQFNYDTKTLKVDVSSDQESYRPGEKAALTVKLSDSSGNPVAGSACIGVVDESIFALAAQNVDIAGQLYQNNFYPDLTRSASYTEYDTAKAEANTGGMGGGDGGAGGMIRETFEDTALFQTVQVDHSGTAAVELQLPHNITSWRVTAAAVAPGVKGGSGIGNVIATLPFSVRAVFTGTYYEGDDISLSITPVTAGTDGSPQSGDPVAYQAELLSSDGKALQTKELSGSIGTSSTANFGKLPVGSYTLSLSGTSGEYQDQIKQPFTVAKEGSIAARVKSCSLEEVSQIQSIRWPVRVAVFDKTLTPYINGINYLSYAGGERIEQIAAAYKAQAAFNNLLPKDQRSSVPMDVRLNEIQTDSGGVKFLPASDASAETTAKFLLAAPDLINSRAAVLYLQEQIGRDEASAPEKIFAYAGLAAAKQPVLQDLKQLLQEESLTPDQRLFLAAGLAKAGDKKGARAVYDSLSDLRKEKDGLIYLDGGSEEERLVNSAAALLVASLSNHSDADGLMTWLLEQYAVPVEGRAAFANLEMLAYLNNFHPELKQTGKFSYTQGGEQKTVELDYTGIACLTFNGADFASANLKAISGQLSANVLYTDYAETAEEASEQAGVSIQKTIQPVSGEWGLGKLVEVKLDITFDQDAAIGCYEVSDTLPSGLRYVDTSQYSMGMLDGWKNGVSQNEGQRITGYLYFNPKESDEAGNGGIEPRAASSSYEEEPVPDMEPYPGAETEDPYHVTITYYANCALPGEFVSPSAAVSLPNRNGSVLSEKGTITIPER